MKLFPSVLAVSAASAAVLLSSAALAQENIGNQGQFVVGVERVTGLFFDRVKTEFNDSTNTLSTTTFALLGNATLFGDGLLLSPSTIPRFGFDYLVIDGLSLGLSAVYMGRSGEVEQETPADTNTADINSQSLFLLQPRIGYAYAFSDTFAIWPRLGFMWAHTTNKEEESAGPMDPLGEETGNFTYLTLEGNLVISPIEHVAFVGGPFLDLGLGGSVDDDPGGGAPSVNRSTKYTSFGLSIGLAAYF